MSKPSMSNDELKKAVQQQLEDEAKHLPASVTERLNQARRDALRQAKTESNGRKPELWAWWQWRYSPALAAVIALLAVLVVINPVNDQSAPGMRSDLPTDFEVVTSDAELDLLAEDFEFYAWAEESVDAS